MHIPAFCILSVFWKQPIQNIQGRQQLLCFHPFHYIVHSANQLINFLHMKGYAVSSASTWHLVSIRYKAGSSLGFRVWESGFRCTAGVLQQPKLRVYHTDNKRKPPLPGANTSYLLSETVLVTFCDTWPILNVQALEKSSS